MGLLEYVYVDDHEIVAFKLIGFAKLLQLSLQSVWKTTHLLKKTLLED
jgi:hypothetical protein